MDMDFATSCPLVRPVLPHIRLLFARSRFRSRRSAPRLNPSDAPSRFRPCASLVLHLHQVAQGTFTPTPLGMPSTQHAARWPAAIPDRGCARRLGDVRPGRRNGACQPNKETSGSRKHRLTQQGAVVTTHAKQRGGFSHWALRQPVKPMKLLAQSVF